MRLSLIGFVGLSGWKIYDLFTNPDRAVLLENPALGVFVSLIGPAVASIIAYVFFRWREVRRSSKVTCRYCASSISADAKVCRFCQRDVQATEHNTVAPHDIAGSGDPSPGGGIEPAPAPALAPQVKAVLVPSKPLEAITENLPDVALVTPLQIDRAWFSPEVLSPFQSWFMWVVLIITIVLLASIGEVALFAGSSGKPGDVASSTGAVGASAQPTAAPSGELDMTPYTPPTAAASNADGPPIAKTEIDDAVRALEDVFGEGGTAGAGVASDECYAKLGTSPTWAAWDGCAAFDEYMFAKLGMFAGQHFSSDEISRRLNNAPRPAGADAQVLVKRSQTIYLLVSEKAHEAAVRDREQLDGASSQAGAAASP